MNLTQDQLATLKTALETKVVTIVVEEETEQVSISKLDFYDMVLTEAGGYIPAPWIWSFARGGEERVRHDREAMEGLKKGFGSFSQTPSKLLFAVYPEAQ